MTVNARLLKISDTLNHYHVWLEGCNDAAGLTWAKIPAQDSLVDTVSTGMVLLSSASYSWSLDAEYAKYRLAYKAQYGGIIRVDVWSSWKRFYKNANLNN
jgi:hypothetical protein